MSQKNFASYGDMETLLTEVASKCGPYTEITYEEWLQLTPYQQEHGRWDVTGVPGADGTISIDLMTKLWENPDPTSAFVAGNITLSSSDYDLLLLVCKLSSTYNGTNSYTSPKGMGGKWDLASYSSNGPQNWVRFTEYVNDTTINIHDAYYVIPGQTGTVENTKLIPYQIYGIKLHQTVEIKAIAPTVSTLAENCVFDPTDTDLESTNVEAAIKELEANFQAGVDDIYDAVVAKGSTPASHSLSDVVTAIAAIPTGITPSGTKSITANGTYDVTSFASASVSVANTVSAAVVAVFDVRSASSAYSFTRSSGYAYIVVAHTDDGTVGAYGIINSAGTIQSWQGATGYFSLTRNSATSFTLKKTSGDSSWSGFIFRAL